MTTQIYNAELVELLRSNFPDRERYAKFAYNINARWLDFPLISSVDGDHFNDNDSSYPEGWTEVDAATTSATNDIYGFWNIFANSAVAGWKYRRQLNVNIEADTPNNTWNSFHWGPIFYRDGNYTADVIYYFGIYADSGGSIDEDTFIRNVLRWNSAAGNWELRTERKNGSTQVDSSWYEFAQYPAPMPIYIHQSMRYNTGTNDLVRGYFGSLPRTFTHTLQMNANMDVTWGQVWAQMHHTRGAGVTDAVWLGAIDRSDNF